MGREGDYGPEIGHRMQARDKDAMQIRGHMMDEAMA